MVYTLRMHPAGELSQKDIVCPDVADPVIIIIIIRSDRYAESSGKSPRKAMLLTNVVAGREVQLTKDVVPREKVPDYDSVRILALHYRIRSPFSCRCELWMIPMADKVHLLTI